MKLETFAPWIVFAISAYALYAKSSSASSAERPVKTSSTSETPHITVPFFTTLIPMYPVGSSRLRHLLDSYSDALSTHVASLQTKLQTVRRFLEERHCVASKGIGRSALDHSTQGMSIDVARRIEATLETRIDETATLWDANVRTLQVLCKPFETLNVLADRAENHVDETAQGGTINGSETTSKKQELTSEFNSFVLIPPSRLVSSRSPHSSDSTRWSETGESEKKAASSAGSYDSALQIIAHTCRDWSQDGSSSRQQLYGPILKVLEAGCGQDGTADGLCAHPPKKSNGRNSNTTTRWWKRSGLASAPSSPRRCEGGDVSRQRSARRVLVPGSGTGRLAWELAERGFNVEANDVSFGMLAVSAAILRHKPRKRDTSSVPPEPENTRSSGSGGENGWPLTLFPYIHNSDTNVGDSSWRRRRVQVPDVTPSQFPQTLSRLSFQHGDFASIYGSRAFRAHFDVVVTCFFLDTATNVIEYLEVIRHVLTAGGVWINHGPLQWHDDNALMISLDEMMSYISDFGFEVESAKRTHVSYGVDDTGGDNTDEAAARSPPLFQGSTRPDPYRPILFVARKVSCK